jgi:hypothetical protein
MSTKSVTVRTFVCDLCSKESSTKMAKAYGELGLSNVDVCNSCCSRPFTEILAVLEAKEAKHKPGYQRPRLLVEK